MKYHIITIIFATILVLMTIALVGNGMVLTLYSAHNFKCYDLSHAPDTLICDDKVNIVLLGFTDCGDMPCACVDMYLNTTCFAMPKYNNYTDLLSISGSMVLIISVVLPMIFVGLHEFCLIDHREN